MHDLLKGHPFLLSRFCKLVPPAMVSSLAPVPIMQATRVRSCAFFAEIPAVLWRQAMSECSSSCLLQVEERDRREVRRIEEKEEYRSKASLDKELVIQIDVPRKAQSADVEVLSGRHGREKAGHGLKHCWPLSKWVCSWRAASLLTLACSTPLDDAAWKATAHYSPACSVPAGRTWTRRALKCPVHLRQVRFCLGDRLCIRS